MRKQAAFCFLSLLVAAVASAQSTPSDSLSLFAAPAYYGYSKALGSESSFGYGIGYQHSFTDRFALEASISREQHRGGSVLATPAGIETLRFTGHTMPVDVIAKYVFATDGRWKPYVGAGLHAAFVRSSPVEGSHGWLGPEVTGGVAFRISRTWSVYVEGRQLVSNNDRLGDPSTRGIVGFRWSF